MEPNIRKRRYRARLRTRAFDSIGWRCLFCKSEQVLQCAHVKPTEMRGPGRGTNERFRDVIANPDSYRPMCRECHRKFDALVHDLYLMVRGVTEEPIPF